MKLLHLADVHLGACPDAPFPWGSARREGIRETFISAVRDAETKHADLLLISGDLFHYPPSFGQLQEVDSVFSMLTSTKVVLIAGNHDYLSPGCPMEQYRWQSDVTFLAGRQMEAVYFPELSATVYGLSYHSRELPFPLYDGAKPENREGFHILLAHGGDSLHIPWQEKALQTSGFDYIAMGHIHIPKIGPGPLANPGSLEPLDKTETGPHGYMEGELTKGREALIRFVPASRYGYKTLSVAVTPQTTSFLLEEQIKDAISRQRDLPYSPVYSLVLTGKRNPEISFSPSSLSRLGPIVEIQDKTIPNWDLTQLYADHRRDMIGMYIQALEKETDPVSQKALYLGLDALLETSRR